MRTENEEIRDHLKYLSLLARDYPSQAAAASEIISTQALLKLPKGTEHFMSDLHGENEAFVHILNSASGVIREKVDIVLGESVPEQTRAELATLIYYPNEKLPRLQGAKPVQSDLGDSFRRVRHYLALPVEGGLRRLDSSLIYYLESEGHRVHFYTEEGDFAAAGTLKAFEEKLAERPFARCNSGYLVNLAQVKGVQQGMVQVGPYELQLSRPRRKAFLAALADHIGGGGA